MENIISKWRKVQADKYFKEYKFNDAIEYYKKALETENISPTVIHSNISACYFELGLIEFHKEIVFNYLFLKCFV